MLRIAFEHIPNFAPVAAIALFAGYQLRSRTLAATVPLAVMALSDLSFGGYHYGVMIAVYASLTLPAVLGSYLRSKLPLFPARRLGGSLLALLSAAIGSSLVFFLVTNFAVWSYFDLYERTWSGLVQCYVQAIPFYRFTLTGDVCFAVALFGALAAYRVCVEAPLALPLRQATDET